MLWTRWIIYGVPLLLALLIGWAAQQARASRAARGPEIVVASGEGVAPTLNPFVPQGEVDRQFAALVHEPLLKAGADGRITGALASEWRWTQETRFWFANEIYAKQALAKLEELKPTRWPGWRLVQASVEANGLRLAFSEAGPRAGEGIAAEIAASGPLPVETIRIEARQPLREHHDYFVAHAIEAAQVKEASFEAPGVCLIQASGETLKLFEELSLFYQNRPELEAKVRLVGRTGALVRPRLTFVLKGGAVFHDGSPVTSEDVAETVRFLQSHPKFAPGREALQLVQMMESSDPAVLQLVFREPYGPSLMAFVDLPVLPARWFGKHAAVLQNGAPFQDDPPPGAGFCRLAERDARGFMLARRDNRPGGVRFLLDHTLPVLRMGLAMKSVDGFWPDATGLADMARLRDIVLTGHAPRSRLLVLWNCRDPQLADPRVRLAFKQATDRPAMVQTLLQGQGTIHEGLFRPGLWFARDLPQEPFDPIRARQTFYELGWVKDGNEKLVRAGKPLHLELLTVAGNADRRRVAEMLASGWRALGAEVTVTGVPPDELLGSRLPDRRFQAVLLGLDVEATWDQSPFWHSTQVGRGLNYAGIADPQLDALLDAMRAEFDLARVPALAHEVEDRLLALHPFLPLFSGGTPLVLRREALPGLEDGGDMPELRALLER